MKKPPKYAFDNDILYLRPKTYTPEDPDAPWYEEVAVDKNTLSVICYCVPAGTEWGHHGSIQTHFGGWVELSLCVHIPSCSGLYPHFALYLKFLSEGAYFKEC